ncbi:hypothetical protein GCM10008983_02850 [Lentibacillus halophilus]|uniref:Uncharacterized protein n=2 Tax=Lentibacillus halophilus TaxID=295065 RepID=A0ABP3IWD1_9BACI
MQSEKEAVKNAGEEAKELFHADSDIENNQKLDTLSMYVPSGLNVVKEEENNIILKDGDQTYIVFYNKLEGSKSKQSYNAAKAKSDEALLLDSFSDKKKFGYIRIMPANDDDQYELQTGIGGVKITTHTPKRTLQSDAESMMKMARSIALSNNQSE